MILCFEIFWHIWEQISILQSNANNHRTKLTNLSSLRIYKNVAIKILLLISISSPLYPIKRIIFMSFLLFSSLILIHEWSHTILWDKNPKNWKFSLVLSWKIIPLIKNMFLERHVSANRTFYRQGGQKSPARWHQGTPMR